MKSPSNAATYREATYQLALASQPKIIVEVGVYSGALSRMLATVPTLERLWVIDSWLGNYSNFGQAHMDDIARGVIAWGDTQEQVTVLRMDSKAAAENFADESIDFWHTDGDHSLEGIRSDIQNWMPKVKKGGILSGDNYEIPTVAQGVKALVPQHELLAKGRLWWARK